MLNRRGEITRSLSEALAKNLHGIDYRAFIFGSQANKADLLRADIDLGILCDQPIPLTLFTKLNNAIEELPMLYKVDLVDFNNVDERFKKVALKNMEWL